MCEEWKRDVLVWCVGHAGCAPFGLAHELDPAYAAACVHAKVRGVEMLCYTCDVSITEITLRGALPLGSSAA